jgi:two-component sensor histidine kinase
VIDRQPRQVDAQQLRYLAALATLVTDRLELRLTARRAAARAAILASEIDHRAMNSLQLIASLLSLQSRIVQAPETSQQLTIAANRVLAVARVHRNFADDETAERVPVLAYLGRLCGELSDSLAVDIHVEGVEASVPAKQMLAIGLIVNELTTNAKKHGAGPIEVTFRPGAAVFELCVLDGGEGLPEDHGPTQRQRSRHQGGDGPGDPTRGQLYARPNRPAGVPASPSPSRAKHRIGAPARDIKVKSRSGVPLEGRPP